MSKLSDETRNRLVAALLGGDTPAPSIGFGFPSLAALARYNPPFTPSNGPTLADLARPPRPTIAPYLATLGLPPVKPPSPAVARVAAAMMARQIDTRWMREEEKEEAVWWRGYPIPDHDPSVWMADRYGTKLKRTDRGKDTPYSWHIDHYPTPRAAGGSDMLDNLEPLHSRTNMSLGGVLGAYFRD